ncbi:helix-turn-helix domain-containing protein [Streptomyces griseoaurantiacus]|uniref:helix-turn-helix domain-containing protein n=1 Tax=Streptomyces griseoaurantiacus TaxID=68213 RepID=UPI0036BE080A
MHGSLSVSLEGAGAFGDFARAWRSRMGEGFALAPFDRGTLAGFGARSRGFRLRDTMFNRFENAAALRTDGRSVGSQDHVRLWIVDRGSWRFGLPGGTEHTVPAGRLLMQTGRLTHFAASPGSAVRILVLPAAEIRHGPDRAASGPGDTPEARLLTAHAATVGRMLDDLGPAGLDAARDTLAELARAVVRGGADDREPRLSPALAQAARDLADRRLTDPALTPTVIAGELNVSVRTLQRAFAGEEHSLSAYIRERRLEGARRALLATGRRASVADVAARWQFADGGHFARLFRRRYGQTPTEYARATAVDPVPVTVPGAPSGR